MVQPAFKFYTPAIAIRSEDAQRSLVTIPKNAVVTVVAGNIKGNGFVKIRYVDQILEMFAKDLRPRGVPTQQIGAVLWG